MPSKSVITPIDEPVEYFFSTSTTATNEYSLPLERIPYIIENEYTKYENSVFDEKQTKSTTVPPFMDQAASADFQPLGHHSSTIIDCEMCGSRMPSRVIYEKGTKTHLSAIIMCLLGLWCCAPLPYFSNYCRTSNHYCGNCHHYLGSYPAQLDSTSTYSLA